MTLVADQSIARTPVLLRTPPLLIVYLVEAISAVGTNLLTFGIFFYTRSVFGWSAGTNLLLAAMEGVFYVLGALSAGRLSGRIAPRTVVAVASTLMALTAATALLPLPHLAVGALLMVYTFLSAIIWPILESFVATGAAGAVMSKRLSTYNLIWAATGPIMLALTGGIIKHMPRMVFLCPVLVHLLAAAMVMIKNRDAHAVPESTPAHPTPEPALVRQRVLALWLSRIALPAAYAVVYGLMALMPSLPIMQKLDIGTQTIVGSLWLIVRWFVFLALGTTVWWHTRPWLMIAASCLMLVAFFGVTMRPTDIGFAAPLPLAVELGLMIFWQAALGVALGVIYTASLYFGMVLSEGSTEHGGYHEALVGVGFILGPGVGWTVDLLCPGKLQYTLLAIGAMVGVTIAGEFAALSVARRSRSERSPGGAAGM